MEERIKILQSWVCNMRVYSREKFQVKVDTDKNSIGEFHFMMYTSIVVICTGEVFSEILAPL